jgi:preprotein translocase subunit SecF
VEIFHNPNIDFLGKKWYFIGLSLVLSVAGILSLLFWHGVPLSIDFRGGTLVTVKFSHAPDDAKIRSQLDAAGLKAAKIQRFGGAQQQEVLIALDVRDTSEASLDAGKTQIVNALHTGENTNKPDLNNASVKQVTDALVQSDPLKAGTDARQRYGQVAQQVVDYRDRTLGGVLSSMDQLSGAVPPQVVDSLKAGFSLSDFSVRNVDIVGPQVGSQLQTQAKLAVLYSLAGMLIYVAFRFEFMYGIAAVIAVAHDTLITVGLFSLLNKEISLTVIAAILTLVGYSMNDTIVIFDRVRENVKLLRREKYEDIVNLSVNQTLNRTVLTSGLTFLTVLSLYVLGGEVLNGFSLALVIGILIGTYSSVFVASPIVVGYHQWRVQKVAPATAAAGSGSGNSRASGGPRREKARVKG